MPGLNVYVLENDLTPVKFCTSLLKQKKKKPKFMKNFQMRPDPKNQGSNFTKATEAIACPFAYDLDALRPLSTFRAFFTTSWPLCLFVTGTLPSDLKVVWF